MQRPHRRITKQTHFFRNHAHREITKQTHFYRDDRCGGITKQTHFRYPGTDRHYHVMEGADLMRSYGGLRQIPAAAVQLCRSEVVPMPHS